LAKVIDPGFFFRIMIPPAIVNAYVVAVDPSQLLPSIGNLIYLAVLALCIAAVMRRDISELLRWRIDLTQELKQYFREHDLQHRQLTEICAQMKEYNRMSERRLEILEQQGGNDHHRRKGDM